MSGRAAIRRRLPRFDESGQDLVEYALLAGLVAVAAGLFGGSISDGMQVIYSRLASKLIVAGG